MNIKTVISMDYSEVDKHINDNFFNDVIDNRKRFSCIASEEWGNYQSHEFDLDGDLDEYEIEDIEDRKFMYMTHTYLNKLVQMGVIPKGKYLIEIYW